MSTKAVIRAWYSGGSQYIFWGVTQISDPLSEYSAGGGYPAAALLSDFVLLDYEGQFSVDDNIETITWGVGVANGYVVYIDSSTGKAELGLANSYSTSRIIGAGYVNTNQVVVGGEYNIYCEGTIAAGKPIFLSESTSGVVTAESPRLSGENQIVVGTTTEAKATGGVGLVKVLIEPDEPMELQQTIDI